MQRVFAWPYRAALAGLYRIGVRAWQLTVASLAMNAWVGVLLLRGDRLAPAVLLIPAGLLDIFDGGVARLRGEESRLGAFLDSVLDRVSDLLLFGCLYWSLAGRGDRLEAGLALATLVISLFVSHLRAEAEAAGVSLSEGLFQRLERYVALVIGLAVPGALLPVLALLTVLGGATVLQRGWSAWHRLGDARLDERGKLPPPGGVGS
jgi:CDP-diacylglycerol--glycerol-3-phosphate 3-phosphatidyltransferase